MVLYAPLKETVFAWGDFSDWELDLKYQAKRDASQNMFWIPIGGLTAGQEYAFQYYIDEGIVVGDPYSEKVLHSNDDEISDATYPNLKRYPSKANGDYVSVLQTNKPEYVWQTTNYQRPASEDLVVYELLVRDFSVEGNYQTVIDSLDYLENLGINAIELMPVTEFSGNKSWGYNPNYYMAPDRSYGTEAKLKEFIDECHSRGIAVILDVVFNQSDQRFPYAWMWSNQTPGGEFAISVENPYFNQIAKHPFSVFYDFNHESADTRKYLDDANKFWLEEYKIDGYRFDLSKGFTQKESLGNQGLWDAYDVERVNTLKRMYDEIRTVDNSAYVILEHLGGNQEERDLGNYGMMTWGIMHSQFKENVLGNSGNSDINRLDYKARGWNFPNFVGYAESHDEERLMVDALLYGQSSGNYNVRDLNTALERVAAANALLMAVPGPKMLWQFGEIGYDYSINYCTDGTISNDCRTGDKPVPVNYFAQTPRKRLYHQMAEIHKLKTEHKLFSASRIDNTGGSQLGNDLAKLVKITANNYTDNPTTAEQSNALVLANMDVNPRTFTPAFHHTGTWYNHYSNTSFNVDDVNMTVTLEPGEFAVFTDFDFPDVSIFAQVAVPVTPSNLTATAGELSVALNWTDNSPNGGQTFVIERKTSTTAFAVIATQSASTTYTDNDVNSGMQYTYRVKSEDGTLSSGYTNEISATPDPISAPSSLMATAGELSVSLSWTGNSTASGLTYEIERKSGSLAFASVATQAGTSYTDNSLVSGTEYTYRVRAVANGENSNYSNEESATPNALVAPTGLTATANGVSIILNWSDNSIAETEYAIQRKGAVGSFAEIATSGANSTTYTDNSGVVGETYTYRVLARNGSQVSATSNEATISEPLANENESLKASIQMYPNPANAQLGFRMENSIQGGVELNITDLVGKELMSLSLVKKSASLEESINISNLPAGIYIFTVKTEAGFASKRFMKQ